MRLHKVKISDVQYPSLVARDLSAIHQMFGDIEIVKVKQCWGRFSMKIWFKKKD